MRADTCLALWVCGGVLALHTNAVLQTGGSSRIVHHMLRTPRSQVHAYMRNALMHVCTMAITFPLAIGVTSLLGWHVYIVCKVRIVA